MRELIARRPARSSTSRLGQVTGFGVIAMLFGLTGLPAAAQENGNAGQSSSTSRNVDDTGIQKAVERELGRELGTRADSIDVSVDSGAVTLAGSVESLTARNHAEREAESVRGVREIKNDIRVEGADRADNEIRRDVEEALRSALESAKDLGVDVKNGIVTLTGELRDWGHRRLADERAGDVVGVREVRDDIRIGAGEDRRPDREVASDILSHLTNDAWLSNSDVRADVRNGRVTLSGDASSVAARQRAILDSQVRGVVAVNAENLEVDHDRAQAAVRRRLGKVDSADSESNAERSDDAIRKAVVYLLESDPHLHTPGQRSSHPNVEVRDRVVTLSGTVDTYQGKQHAAKLASEVEGARDVRNDLDVARNRDQSNDKTDAHLLKNVEATIKRDAYLHSDDISVVVTNGVVTLQGVTDSRYARRRAELVTGRIPGVRDVRDELKVLPPGEQIDSPRRVQDAKIREDIQDELFWSPFVDSDQVQVAVMDGVATLSGTVSTYGERNAAVENAREGGASRVVDHLRVQRTSGD